MLVLTHDINKKGVMDRPLRTSLWQAQTNRPPFVIFAGITCSLQFICDFHLLPDQLLEPFYQLPLNFDQRLKQG
jgi:hypothetical protein